MCADGAGWWARATADRRLPMLLGSVLDLRNMQLFLGRRFRSLKVWFVLRSYGQEGFRRHLRTS